MHSGVQEGRYKAGYNGRGERLGATADDNRGPEEARIGDSRRVSHGKEFEAERQIDTKKHESRKRLEEMHAYMDNLVKLVEGTAKEHSKLPELTVHLVRGQR